LQDVYFFNYNKFYLLFLQHFENQKFKNPPKL